MPRERYERQALGTPMITRIKQSRVLMVGAGGIGCELLKNLVLSGFAQIDIVDLDTIDLSNLNRQFLFRHEHIKRSKALVAKESATGFNPNVKIEAHHANIKDPKFNIDWFKKFNIVFNALDNIEARRHVNRMCLAADVPLIESGTTGFEGQVQVIKRGVSQCYDCTVKDTPKTFPVCTIRSTPSQPIHCIVWGKSYLFAEVFGTSEEDSPELDTRQDSENAEEIEKLRQEAQALKRIRDSMGSDDFPRKVFEKVFADDIVRLGSMEDMWQSREKPKPLDYDELEQESAKVDVSVTRRDQTPWTAAENFAVFCASTKLLSNRLESMRAQVDTGNSAAVLSFDKDDKIILDFVASSANLRAIIFGIETRSEFDIKQMAGNIIPAIATTNAMIAGLCVLQAFKVLKEDYAKAKYVSICRQPERALNSERLQPPNPECVVCGISQTRVEADLTRATLQDLVEGLLQKELGYGEELSIRSGENILYDQDLDDNLSKKLSDMNVTNDSFVTIVDEEDNEPRVDLVLSIIEKALPEDSQPITLTEKVEIARKPKPVPTSNGENGHPETNGVTGKRKRNADEAEVEADIVKKRGKVMEENPSINPTADGDDEVVIVNDNNDGSILIED